MLMQGKKGIVMGLANKFSIAYGIARALKEHGAEIVFTAQSDYFAEKIKPLTDEFGSLDPIICDVSQDGQIEDAFDAIYNSVGPIDFIVHSIAFADKNELKGRYCDTSRSNFITAMNVSCFSFVETCRHAEKIMPNGGSIMALTYYGSQKVMPNYNVMAIAKAALESSVMYLANDLGESKIRVNTISAGPIKTLAASGVSDLNKILEHDRKIAPLGRNVSQEDIGGAAVFLMSDLSSGVTGDTLYVDCGANVIGCKLGC